MNENKSINNIKSFIIHYNKSPKENLDPKADKQANNYMKYRDEII